MNEHALDPRRDEAFRLDAPPDLPAAEVLEVPLLLAGWQVSALEKAAHQRGLTAGEMVRHLLRDFFGPGPLARPRAQVR